VEGYGKYPDALKEKMRWQESRMALLGSRRARMIMP
jgi:hypothetical protein